MAKQLVDRGALNIEAEAGIVAYDQSERAEHSHRSHFKLEPSL